MALAWALSTSVLPGLIVEPVRLMRKLLTGKLCLPVSGRF